MECAQAYQNSFQIKTGRKYVQQQSFVPMQQSSKIFRADFLDNSDHKYAAACFIVLHSCTENAICRVRFFSAKLYGMENNNDVQSITQLLRRDLMRKGCRRDVFGDQLPRC